MAKVLYFNGDTELTGIFGLDNAKFADAFPNTTGRRFDSFQKLVGYPTTPAAGGLYRLLPVERIINFKSNPSRHECDARCINASGRVMNCECSCGGKNHGAGKFNCSEAA